ncbi:protoporphyrinogen oxidase HemJ [Rhizobium sp. L1K21]|uniref:protoporphyrinogen oxidase HemJ n=1 Tax=Rhizobium sp. L1K21 TaxID=2954933 RepID=UPI002093A8CD|nr:protoporphyrinogen oxidase HemJ [Rhizobium sp. L1K21]MCO6188006.1 protoporphyrinogen oxidase HemJ [Rhizobium sp. L1K21]
MAGGKSDGGSKAGIRAAVALTLFLLVGFALYVADEQSRYLWMKSLHVIAVISWMAGLFYMPRLFIYHTGAAVGSEASETFKVMERRLMTVIMWPAMVLSWVFGLWMAWFVFGFQGGWLHMKIAAVVLLTVAHVHQARSVRAFHNDERLHSERYWRLMNEVPTVLMIVIVVLVIVKPFG